MVTFRGRTVCKLHTRVKAYKSIHNNSGVNIVSSSASCVLKDTCFSNAWIHDKKTFYTHFVSDTIMFQFHYFFTLGCFFSCRQLNDSFQGLSYRWPPLTWTPIYRFEKGGVRLYIWQGIIGTLMWSCPLYSWATAARLQSVSNVSAAFHSFSKEIDQIKLKCSFVLFSHEPPLIYFFFML